ncbi:MAG: trigger factor [Alphaproteobacteria bacterium]
MQVTELKADGLKREFKVIIKAKDIEQKVASRLESLSQQVTLPGFRPGKAPASVLKKRYGASVMGEVLQDLVQDGSAKALADKGLRPAAQPKVEIKAFDEGKDLEFDVAVELLPDIEIPDFGQVKLERKLADVTDAEIESSLKRMAENMKRTKLVEAARPAAKGDTVVIDFAGSIDGDKRPEMGGTGHHLELGSNSFIPGFEDQLVGKKSGEVSTIKVTFPKDYAKADLAGRDALFDVTIKELREAEPAVLDDDFAKQMGLENLEALRKALRERMVEDYGHYTRMRLKRDLLDQLAKIANFKTPEGLVDTEFETIWKQVEDARARGEDVDEDGKSEADVKTEYRDIAERRVRLGLLLAEVGRVNNIQVSESDLDRAALAEARRYPGQEQQVIEYYRQTAQARESLRAPVFEDKVIDFIVELAKVSDRHVPLADLLADSDEGDSEKGATAAAKTAKKKSSARKKASE